MTYAYFRDVPIICITHTLKVSYPLSPAVAGQGPEQTEEDAVVEWHLRQGSHRGSLALIQLWER